MDMETTMRARIKSIEDMPKRLLCCPETVKDMTPYFGMIVEVSNIIIDVDYPCPHCGYPIKEKGLWVNVSSGYPIDSLDIDEGGK